MTAVYIMLGASLLLSLTCFVFLLLLRLNHVGRGEFSRLQQNLADEIRAAREDTTSVQQQMLRLSGESQTAALQQAASAQDRRLASMQNTVAEQYRLIETRLDHTSRQNEQKLENIRQTMENRMEAMQHENARSLDEMRKTVDEKLQKTLEEKLQRSFETVSTQLEQVYRGLGEMQALANGVGDLKRVLSNVKTRGILGEIQLGSILEEILSPEQYEKNIVTRPGRRDPVEFAIRLPGDGDVPVLLPVDAKFPLDLYARLADAYDAADAAAIDAAGRELEQRIRMEARDVHEKYVEPPYTTDFAILFFPTEGLYAEAVRRGLVERLQRDYKVNIAGPSTMAALLNSLQMGFQTLAIQRRSNEVWHVLAGVKTEFDTFADALTRAQNRIKQADNELDNLLGVRTRQMQRRLRGIQTLDAPVTEPLIPEELQQ